MEYRILDTFRNQLEVELSDNSVINYCGDIKNFLEDTKEKFSELDTEEKIIKALTPFMAQDIFLDMRKKYVMTTYNRKVTSLKMFGEYLVGVGLKDINVFQTIKAYSPVKVRSEKISRPHKQMLTIEEVKKVLDTDFTDIPRWDSLKVARTKFILALMYTTGMRISEVINAKFSDLEKIKYGNKEVYMLNITEHKTSNHNGAKKVPIANRVLNLFEDYLVQRKKIERYVSDEVADYIIISNQHKLLSTTSSSNNIEEMVKICGIEKKIKNHNQRVGFRTALSYKGVNETVVRQIGGWSLTDIERAYVYDKDENISKIETCNIL